MNGPRAGLTLLVLVTVAGWSQAEEMGDNSELMKKLQEMVDSFDGTCKVLFGTMMSQLEKIDLSQVCMSLKQDEAKKTIMQACSEANFNAVEKLVCSYAEGGSGKKSDTIGGNMELMKKIEEWSKGVDDSCKMKLAKGFENMKISEACSGLKTKEAKDETIKACGESNYNKLVSLICSYASGGSGASTAVIGTLTLMVCTLVHLWY